MSFLYNFPDESLEILFEMCDVYTLLQLKNVCKRFYRISNKVLAQKSNRLLITNEMSEKFRERCKPLLYSYISKFITYYNWKYEIYKRNEKCESYESSMDDASTMRLKAKCLKMTRDTIWFYDYKVLYACNRAENGNIKEKIAVVNCSSPISCIAYCNDIIISGHSNGSIRHWRIESRDNNIYLQQLNVHFNVYANHVSNIEATTHHIISSSSNLIKIQKLKEDSSAEESETIYSARQLVQSISLDPTGTKFAASAGQSFLIYDINENRQIKDKWIELEGKFFPSTCSQLLWQDPHTILMLYERRIKKMDIRIMDFVHTWDASFLKGHRKLYSFSSDNLYTIMTGTNYNEVILWDQRLSDSVQTYDMSHYYCLNNPVFSVQFDSTHMYVVTKEEGLIEFDFKGIYHFDRARKKKCFSNFI